MTAMVTMSSSTSTWQCCGHQCGLVLSVKLMSLEAEAQHAKADQLIRGLHRILDGVSKFLKGRESRRVFGDE